MMDLFSILLKPLFSLVGAILGFALLCVFAFLAFVVVKLWLSIGRFPLSATPDKLRSAVVSGKYFNFLRWVIIDIKERSLTASDFCEYGFTFFTGRQGSGKTTAMVEKLGRIKKRFPECLIVTNFQCIYADFIMHDWSDLLNVRNGTLGVVFAIDEIHSEYSSADWKDVPDTLLSEISQQRKQRVKILATCQYFGRVAKPLREQANDVVSCSCIAGRLIRTRSYDALQYSTCIDNISGVTKKLRPYARHSFVSDDDLRSCFDTYEKIERMRRADSKKTFEGRCRK